MVTTFVGVALPLWAWFYLCRRGFTSVGVVLPLREWFFLYRRGVYLCWRGNTVIGFGFTFVGVVLPT